MNQLVMDVRDFYVVVTPTINPVTESGIHLPESVRLTSYYTVVAVGEHVDPGLLGEEVVIRKGAEFTEFMFAGKECLAVTQNEIVCSIREEKVV